MTSIDNEILLEAEDDARAVEFIRKALPQNLKERFSDDELYYFLDVISDYYVESGVFDNADNEEYVDLDLDQVVDYVIKKAKKENMGSYEHDDILFVVQAELDYAEQQG